ncbi:Fic family protein [Algoriphagus antarcticus]|uniref:Fic family protein n=1 Tax=Algoriphagus antarcticus TaxID=238540 RepID=UPI002937050C|nr:Fic family protein [Algoriphagus antarcticus]
MPKPIANAPAILESIVKNHPFTDGNKRTGYVLTRLLLMEANLHIHVNQDQKFKLIISVSIGKLSLMKSKNGLNSM